MHKYILLLKQMKQMKRNLVKWKTMTSRMKSGRKFLIDQQKLPPLVEVVADINERFEWGIARQSYSLSKSVNFPRLCGRGPSNWLSSNTLENGIWQWRLCMHIPSFLSFRKRTWVQDLQLSEHSKVTNCRRNWTTESISQKRPAAYQQLHANRPDRY